ncbi:MAG: hypothetical protein NUV69_00175, partial [Candidatus Curtissbacteria bacterium]|nr:hypothetical protein [Candidatus Curtissbacteria bacterium]
AGQDIDSKVRTQKWKISGYDKRLVPVGGVYNFFADRFLKKAQSSGQNLCAITGGTRNGFWYCNSNATFDSTSAMAGSSVWFIDGDLTIKKNLTIGVADSVTFIVRGNITVETGVDRVDGLYVTNGTFSDYDPLAGKAGRQLVINGGVYARTVNLGRILGGTLCPSGTQCNNSQTAAVKLVYDPKYLLGLNTVLGSPDLDWREVAP